MGKYTHKNIGLGYLALVLLFTGFAVLFMTPTQDACAGAVAIADSPCDEDYYDAMVARATLEADREVTQNQNLIYKPDSVLDYTCFERHLGVLGTRAQDMFSETTRWGNDVLGSNQDEHMNVALRYLVEDALTSYISLNFHGSGERHHLGGRASSQHRIPDGDVPNGESYSCSVMESVWMEAKCMDFIDDPDTDGFYTFDYYVSEADLRRLPSPCSGGPDWAGNLADALNSPAWTDDPLVTYLNYFDASQCGSLDEIPTGLEVERPIIDPQNYEEFVCIQPGCHWDPDASACVP